MVIIECESQLVMLSLINPFKKADWELMQLEEVGNTMFFHPSFAICGLLAVLATNL